MPRHSHDTPRPENRALGLAGWLAATFVTASIGAVASTNAPEFYGQLAQPAWAPPAWLFGPVWSVLYVVMGISAWLVWREYGFRGASTALTLFVVQLLANGLWSWCFIVWRQGALSLAEIGALWLLIAGTIRAFWRLHRVAALLLVPYLAWVSFAAALTASLLRLNPTVLG